MLLGISNADSLEVNMDTRIKVNGVDRTVDVDGPPDGQQAGWIALASGALTVPEAPGASSFRDPGAATGGRRRVVAPSHECRSTSFLDEASGALYSNANDQKESTSHVFQ
jgi:hypothetical protein